jgi:hypothetical protein
VYGEIQHCVIDDQFMALVTCEGDFYADILAYTVKENLKQCEVALTSVEHLGYCDQC